MKKKPLVVALSMLLPVISATTVSASEHISPAGRVTDKYSGNTIQLLGEFFGNASGRSVGTTFTGNAHQDIISMNGGKEVYSQDDVFTGKVGAIGSRPGWSQLVEGGTVSHATFNDGATQHLGAEDNYPDDANLQVSTSLNSVFNNSAQIVGGGYKTEPDGGSFGYAWQGISSGDTFNGTSTQVAEGTGRVEHARFHNSSTQTLKNSATSTDSVFTGNSVQSVNGTASSHQDIFQDQAEQVLNDTAHATGDTFSGQSIQQINGSATASNDTFHGRASQALDSTQSHAENESFYEQSAQNIKAGTSSNAKFYNNAVLQMSGGATTGAIFNGSSGFYVQGGTVSNATLNDNTTGLLDSEGVATGTTHVNNHASLTIVARPTYDPVSRQAEAVALNGGTLNIATPEGNNPNPVATVGNLTVNGGTVQFMDTHPDANGHFTGLAVDTLKGSGGTLVFNASLAESKSNVLTAQVIGPGHYHLRINDATDSKALTLKTLMNAAKLDVIHTTTKSGNQATYDLVDINGKKIDTIDLGVHLGDLGKDDKGNVVIHTITNKTTRSTDALLGALSSGLFISDGEMQNVRSRRGELQNGGADGGGVWGRYLNNNTHVDAAGSAAYRLEQNGMEIGGDKIFSFGDNRLALGLFGSYSKNNLKQDRGNSSNVDSWGSGLYATWFGAQGYYVDGVVKYNRFNTAVRSQTETGLGVNGEFKQNGLGVSLETGYRFNLPAEVFIEPYIRTAYFTADGQDVTLSNGLEAKADRLQSVRGETGVSAGKRFEMNGGMTISPYVTVAVEHEFDKNNNVRMNDAYNFNNDFSGTTGRYGVGVTSQLTRNASVYLEANYRKGEHVESPVMGNAGFRVSF